jgi:hypothetical protein
MIIKPDGSQMPYEPTDFRVNSDMFICGRSIRIYDCDQYTREFFDNIGQSQGEAGSCPTDSFYESQQPKPVKKDKELLEFLEKKLGGGKV